MKFSGHFFHVRRAFFLLQNPSVVGSPGSQPVFLFISTHGEFSLSRPPRAWLGLFVCWFGPTIGFIDALAFRCRPLGLVRSIACANSFLIQIQAKATHTMCGVGNTTVHFRLSALGSAFSFCVRAGVDQQ